MKTKEEINTYKREWARKSRTNPTTRERLSANSKRYHEKHKEVRLAASRQWKAKNKDKVQAYRKEYWMLHKDQENNNRNRWVLANPDRWKELQKLDQDKHGKARRIRRRPKLLAYQNKRYKTDENYRIEKRLRAGLNQALRKVKVSKRTSLINLLGCSVEDTKRHIEAKFTVGMTWDNIHIDHIRPCCSFDLTDETQQKQCFHYTNLQPLFASDNLKKSGKWEEEDSIDV